jgi:hypothetical protein
MHHNVHYDDVGVTWIQYTGCLNMFNYADSIDVKAHIPTHNTHKVNIIL